MNIREPGGWFPSRGEMLGSFGIEQLSVPLIDFRSRRQLPNSRFPRSFGFQAEKMHCCFRSE